MQRSIATTSFLKSIVIIWTLPTILLLFGLLNYGYSIFSIEHLTTFRSVIVPKWFGIPALVFVFILIAEFSARLWIFSRPFARIENKYVFIGGFRYRKSDVNFLHAVKSGKFGNVVVIPYVGNRHIKIYAAFMRESADEILENILDYANGN